MNSLSIPHYSRLPEHIRHELSRFEGPADVKYMLEISLFAQLEISDLHRYISERHQSTLQQAAEQIIKAAQRDRLTPEKVAQILSLRQGYIAALCKVLELTGEDLAQLLREASRRLPHSHACLVGNQAGVGLLPERGDENEY